MLPLPAQEVGNDVSDPDAKWLLDQQETINWLKADAKKYKRQRNVAVTIVGISGLGIAAWWFWCFSKHVQISVHTLTNLTRDALYVQTYSFDMPLLTVWRNLGKTIVVRDYINENFRLPTQTS